MVHLELLTPDTPTQTCHLPDGNYSLGRAGENHIVVAHSTVSDRHCELLVYRDEVIVRDNDSRNGTFVDEVAVHGQKGICNGQRLRVGDIQLRVHIDPPDDPDDTDESATRVFHQWLRSDGEARVEPPRFPIFFVPGP